MKRESLPVADIDGHWPILSVPNLVRGYFRTLVGRLPPDVKVEQVGQGYHNAGWSYIEVEVKAPSWGRAFSEAKRLQGEVMWEFQWQKMKGEEG